MSRFYIRLLAVAAAALAITGASFSIAGLMKLFAGSAKPVAFMAGALEFSKLVATGFLYRYWGHIHRTLRVYLVFAVVTLVVVTSVGIFGFLSNAYQVASLEVRTQTYKIKALEEEQARLATQSAQMKQFIEEIPSNRISRKFEFQKRYDREMQRLDRRAEGIRNEIVKLKSTLFAKHTELGPVTYIAETLGADPDSIVRALILLFVSVFDPLAVCLVFCLNLAIRIREKYRGDEFRIGSNALATPVDHRFKKKAA